MLRSIIPTSLESAMISRLLDSICRDTDIRKSTAFLQPVSVSGLPWPEKGMRFKNRNDNIDD